MIEDNSSKHSKAQVREQKAFSLCYCNLTCVNNVISVSKIHNLFDLLISRCKTVYGSIAVGSK